MEWIIDIIGIVVGVGLIVQGIGYLLDPSEFQGYSKKAILEAKVSIAVWPLVGGVAAFFAPDIFGWAGLIVFIGTRIYKAFKTKEIEAQK